LWSDSTVGSSHERRVLAAGIHEATLAVGMAVGTIVGGVLGTMANRRIPYLLAAAVLLVMIVMQSIAWWRWIRCPRQNAFQTDVDSSTVVRKDST